MTEPSSADIRKEELLQQFRNEHRSGGQPNVWEYWNRGDPGDDQVLLLDLIDADICERVRRSEQPWISDYLDSRLWPHREYFCSRLTSLLFRIDNGDVAEQLGIASIGSYLPEQLIGVGGFGVVLKVKNKGGSAYALKIAHPDTRSRQLLDHEISVLKTLQPADGLPRLHDVVHHHRFGQCAVTNFVTGTTLTEWLRRNPSDLDRLDVCQALLRVIDTLHDRSVYHWPALEKLSHRE